MSDFDIPALAASLAETAAHLDEHARRTDVKTDRIVDVDAYERERAQTKNYYTTRLKSLSASDPEYARLWNERSAALKALAEKHGLPTGTEN